jgi:3-oxoacyl-[acyl-carrier-protein] synthase II
MASTSRRAVLTGVGLLTPIGNTKEAFWDALDQGRGGIGPIQSFDPSGLPTRIAGEVRDFDAKSYVDKKERKSLKVMSRTIQLAVAASQLALQDAGVTKEQLDPTRFGVEFGAGLIGSELDELGAASKCSSDGSPGVVDYAKWGTEGLAAMPPLWMLKYLPNMLACHVSILQNAQGPCNSITQNDVAGLLALGEAYRILARGAADFFLVGGADSRINPLTMVRDSLFMPLSRRNEQPTRASRPFDRGRDGIVPGEGAGVFALEEIEHARKRGARIYAEVIGFGSSYDRSCTGAGLARAIRAALKEADAAPETIDHVNAQGFSELKSDIWEARGIREVFGNCRNPVPVFAPKSYFGNLGAGAASTELAASVLALEHAMLPATLNYEEPDPDCPLPVAASRQPVRGKQVLKVSCTAMGQCAALVIRKV